MIKNSAKINLSADQSTCKILQKFLQSYPTLMPNSFTETKDIGITISSDSFQRTFPAPLRLGKVLDEIERHIHTQKTEKDRFLNLKDATLDTHLGLFTRPNGGDVTLTEKEVEILVILSQQNDKPISRDDLLRAVWNYAEGVETHTLETHIYRLRQKIEQSPSEPKILITKNGGYIIGT